MPPRRSRATLHTYVSNLRHALGDVIVRHGDGYLRGLHERDDRCNGVRGRLPDARSAMGDADEVSSRLREALAMWRGHPYADIEAHGLLDGEITRLTELRLAALEARIDADLRGGRHREVIAELDALTVEHPFRENLRALHMLALYRSGRQGEALRAFGQTREVLVEGLGIDPSPELKDLERRILDQDRTLLISRRARRCDGGRSSSPISTTPAGTTRPNASSPSPAASRSWRRRRIAADGIKLAPKGTAGYAVFVEPIDAVRAARRGGQRADPCGRSTWETSRWARTSRSGRRSPVPPASSPSPIPVRCCCRRRPMTRSRPRRERAGPPSRWGASTSSASIPGLHIYQLVGNGFRSEFPELLTDRLPPAVPSAVERSMPGYELRALDRRRASSVRSTAPTSRRSAARSRCGSSGRGSSVIPSSCAGSRPPRSASPGSSTPTSCRSSTTGGSPTGPSW